MNGTFTYSNLPLTELVGMACGIFSFFLMPYNLPMGVTALLLTAALIYLLTHITGHYETDWESVTFKILWKTCRIDFCEIQSVRTNIRRGKHMRPNGTFRVEVELILRTYREDIDFCARHIISTKDLLQDPDCRQQQFDNLDLIQLGRYIKSKLGEASA